MEITDPGESEDFGQEGYGEGSVWTLDPATDRLTCIFQSENPQAGNNFDNITVSPRGGVLLCEDGGGVEDAFGMGERLMGLTPATVEKHLRLAREALDVETTAQAVLKAAFYNQMFTVDA